MSFLRSAAFSMLLVAAVVARAETATNVAQGKPVTLNGVFFVDGWGGPERDPALIVDGEFFPRSTQWDAGVWWNTRNDTGGQSIEIDLGDTYVIESLIAQVDDNDTFEIRYLNAATGSWDLAWTVPNFDVIALPNGILENAWGHQTRPNPFDDTERHPLVPAIETRKLRVIGIRPSDDMYAVSEIQAFGYPAITPVAIDVMPGTSPNLVTVSARGELPVAFVSAPGFDATQVLPATVTVANARVAQKKDGSYKAIAEDVDGDGVLDLVVKVLTTDLGVGLGPTRLVVDGFLPDGRHVRGSDDVVIVAAQ